MGSTTGVYLKLNNITDADVLQRLAEVGNKQGYIKSLIRADMERSSTMQTYRHTDGRVIYDRVRLEACGRLRDEVEAKCAQWMVESDISDTHCSDVAWEDVECMAEPSPSSICGWSEFEAAWRRAEGSFPFMAMTNGYAYEYRPSLGCWELAFDPGTLGQGDVLDYPVWFGNSDRMGQPAPSELYEVDVCIEDRMLDTGVFTADGYNRVVHPA